jgi:hypothetical protein
MKALTSILFVLLMAVSLNGCIVYTPYVTIQPQDGIPAGSTEVTFNGTLDQVRAAFTQNNIFVKSIEDNQGLETEETLLDKGTRAKYKIYDMGGGRLKMVPYYGITAAVKSTMVAWVGYAAASAYDTSEWFRCEYTTAVKARPNMVFNYGVQIIKSSGSSDLIYR